MRKITKFWKNQIGFLLAAVFLAVGASGCGSLETGINDDPPILSEALQLIADAQESLDAENKKDDIESDSLDIESLQEDSETENEVSIQKDGEYTGKEEVALYLYTYGELPSNFITKKEAAALGWEGGSLEPYAPGKSIGGDYFGNYEGALPQKRGREYHECDIDTKGAKKRGAKRIVYSNDGLIYYTEDHYETYELLYGEE